MGELLVHETLEVVGGVFLSILISQDPINIFLISVGISREYVYGFFIHLESCLLINVIIDQYNIIILIIFANVVVTHRHH